MLLEETHFDETVGKGLKPTDIQGLQWQEFLGRRSLPALVVKPSSCPYISTIMSPSFMEVHPVISELRHRHFMCFPVFFVEIPEKIHTMWCPIVISYKLVYKPQ
jgi:hypothetical protein